jgi:hypothetical protein
MKMPAHPIAIFVRLHLQLYRDARNMRECTPPLSS